MAHLNTVDSRKVQKMIERGDQNAKLIFEAMAYQIAKGIGELATVVKGDVDGVILTGGLAYSKILTEWIKERVEFIGEVIIIPGENDSEADLRDLFDWAASVSRRLPIHLSKYHPDYNMGNPPTPTDTLRRAYELARERLDFVYVGNVDVDGTADTICPSCGAVAVRRSGFSARLLSRDGNCGKCGEALSIVT